MLRNALTPDSYQAYFSIPHKGMRTPCIPPLSLFFSFLRDKKKEKGEQFRKPLSSWDLRASTDQNPITDLSDYRQYCTLTLEIKAPDSDILTKRPESAH